MKTIKFSRSVMYTGAFLFLFTLVLIGCKDSVNPKTLPSVITGEVTNTTTTSTTVSGQIVDDGNVTVTERGVVIGVTTDPTIEDTKVTSGNGEGTFSVDLSGLTANTTYHVRAFGTNAVGTSYGLDKSFTTSATLPTVTTTSITEITIASSKSGGNVTDDGGSAITARGVCWSLNPNPTIADSVSVDGSGSGSFVSSLSKLTYNQTYYVRAYATNSVGTAYGSEITFSTPTSPIPTNGLVGWWPFNGNANDESGNGNDGVVNGSILIKDRNENINSAYGFDGVDDYIGTNLIGIYPIGLSISVWVKSNFVYSNYEHKGIVFSRVNTLGGRNVGIISQDTIQSSGFLYTGAYDNSGTVGYGVATKFIPNDNYWHHITGTASLNPDLNQQIYSLFVDGKLIATQTHQYTFPIEPIQPFLFGKDNIDGYGNRNWNGALDDIAIYNRALTPEEIQKIYNGTGF